MKMNIYLLDTDIASAFFDKGDENHKKAYTFVENAAKSGDHIYVPCIAIAEIRYGLALYANLDKVRSKEVDKSLKAYTQITDIGKATAPHYANIRAELMKMFAKTKTNGLIKKVRPETLIDKTTSLHLGIQENDLWLASIAVQYKMILVSEDKMTHIKKAYPSLLWVKWK